ncbi:hypothetical protein MMC26_007063 [Xylographa opegraphella]|nr:hypothetical protein [Xylographa opegraphella]
MPSHLIGQKPSSNQSNWSSHHDFSRDVSNGRILPRQPLPSPAMQYYDYSEAFVEKQEQHDLTISVLSLAEEAIPEVQGRQLRAQEVARKALAVNTKPVSQALQAVGDVSEQVPHKSMPPLESPSPVAAPGKFLQQMSDWENEHISLSAPPQNKRSNEKVNHNDAARDDDDEHEIVERPAIRDTYGHHILSSSRPEARNRFVRDSRDSITDAAVQPAPIPHKSHGNDSTRALRTSIGELNDTQEIPATPPTATEQPRLVPWHISSLDFGGPQCGTMTQDLAKPSYQKPRLPTLVSEPLLSSIRAPMPERSMSSRTNKDRFSRIFSIDDSFDDLDDVVMDSEQDRPSSERVSAIEASGNDHSVWSGASSILPVTTTKIVTGSNVNADAVKTQDFLPVLNRSSRGYSQTESDKFLHIDNAVEASAEILRQPTIMLDSAISHASPTVVKHEKTPNIFSDSHRARQGSSHFSNQPESLSMSTKANMLSQTCPENESIQELPVMTLLEAASVVPWEYDELKDGESFTIGRYRLKSKAERDSERTSISASNLRSRNLQSSQSRFGPSSNSDPSIVRSSYDSPNPTGKAPKFKLKITRASSSTNDTVKITRQRSLSSSPRPSFAIGADFFRTVPIAQESISEDHSGSVHDLNPMASYRTFPAHAHFKEQLDNSAMSACQSALRPPSSNQNTTEVRSFFSDDSSNMDRRGGLRMRISQLKAIASRGNSTDDLRAAFRPQVSKGDSRPQSDRNSDRNHEATRGMSTIKYKTWKLRQKVRSWWHHGEEKLKDLGGKVKRSRRKRSTSTELYPGV